MARKLVWTEKALLTKKEIFDYWNEATGNKKYSRKLETEFEKVTDSILLFPSLGRELENYDARVIINGHYSVIYKFIQTQADSEIRILHIWDTRRDPDNLKL
jgi:plasmid stabilization system protein ParE